MSKRKQKAIILRANDEIEKVDYDPKNIMPVFKQLNDLPCTYAHDVILPMPSGMQTLHLDFYCGDSNQNRAKQEGLNFNALTPIILESQVPVYGDVIILVNEGYGENRGFYDVEGEIDECWIIEDLLLRAKNQNIEALKEFHKNYDFSAQPSPRKHEENDYGEKDDWDSFKEEETRSDEKYIMLEDR